jgi:hypothetical protein
MFCHSAVTMPSVNFVARKYWAVMAIAVTLATPALTQPAPLPQTVDPKACSDEQRLKLDDKNAPRDSSNLTLSEKLDRTEGVICPPNVDPEIKAPTPNAGNTPIIPPPGSPGGDPNIRPK